MQRDHLLAEIQQLPPDAQFAFAAACTERVLPIHERRNDETWGVSHNAVHMAWARLAGEPVAFARWTRMEAFLERINVSIDQYGPEYQSRNSVSIAARMMTITQTRRSSGDPELDNRERSRAVLNAANAAMNAVDDFIREMKALDPSASFSADGGSESRWQELALDAVKSLVGAAPERSTFEQIEDASMNTGRGLDGSTSGWFPWSRARREAPGADLTLFKAGMVHKPKVVYYIFHASNEVKDDGSQKLGSAVADVIECAKKDAVARYSYYLHEEALRDSMYLIITHVLVGEFLIHKHGDDCEFIRFRELNQQTFDKFPYPAFASASVD